MIAQHPYRAVGAVLSVTAACLLLAGLIGQRNDGPWGDLPAWLGAVSWFGFLGSAVALLVLSAYLVVARLRARRAVA